MNSQSLPVALQRCDSYSPSVIAELIDRIVPSVGLSSSLHGKKVLLKPNLISSIGPRLACTHGGFIAGVAMWFQAHGAKVLVGDSPAFGSAVKVCRTQKILGALADLNVRVVNFVSPVAVKLSGGMSVTVAREALECDLFVGLPKIKAHNQMYVTMAVKNIFGIVKGSHKAMLHMVHGNSHDQFAAIILDLVSILPPQLHLADAIEVMDKSGPLDGSHLTLHCVAGARCPVAMDTALLALLQLRRRQSPLWRGAALRGLGGSEFEKLSFPLLTPQDFHGSGFHAPEILYGIRFNPVRFLKNMMKRLVLKNFN